MSATARFHRTALTGLVAGAVLAACSSLGPVPEEARPHDARSFTADASATTFAAMAYIIVVNPAILVGAGLPIGPGRVIDAIRAVEVVGFTGRSDFYWTLQIGRAHV